MKINLDAPLCNLDGTPITIDSAGKPATLAFACVDACLRPQRGDAEVPGQAARAYALARALNEGGEQDLSVEDVAFLKTRIEQSHTPLIVGQAWELLEGR